MKVCTKCRLPKEFKDFHKTKATVDGYHTICKLCRCFYQKEYRKSHLQKLRKRESYYNKVHRDERAKYNRQYWNLNHELLKQKQREYWRTNKGRFREKYLLKFYNMTIDSFDKLFEKQEWCCAICKSTSPGGKHNQWNIDHNHSCCSGKKSCGKCVRGILCRFCNNGLGVFLDNPKLLKDAADYLEKRII